MEKYGDTVLKPCVFSLTSNTSPGSPATKGDPATPLRRPAPLPAAPGAVPKNGAGSARLTAAGPGAAKVVVVALKNGCVGFCASLQLQTFNRPGLRRECAESAATS